MEEIDNINKKVEEINIDQNKKMPSISSLIVIGMAGSGKTTFIQVLNKNFLLKNRD